MSNVRAFSEEREYKIGEKLPYTLRPEQRPSPPDRLYVGRIRRIFIEIHDRLRRRYYEVEILQDGFTGETELVYPEQIIHDKPPLILPSIGPGPNMGSGPTTG